MEFPFDCEDILNVDDEGYVILRGKDIKGYAGYNTYTSSVKFKQGEKVFDKSRLTPMDKLSVMIDRVGCSSGVVGGGNCRLEGWTEWSLRWIDSRVVITGCT